MKQIVIRAGVIFLVFVSVSPIANPPALDCFVIWSRDSEIYRLTKQQVDVTPLQEIPSFKLKDLINFLETKSPKIKGKIVVDSSAFAAINAADVMETEVTFQDFPPEMKFGTILRLALSKYDSKGKCAEFMIRDGRIQITIARFDGYEEHVLRVYPYSGPIPESFWEARIRELRQFAKNLNLPVR